MAPARSRNWCFTVNADEATLIDWYSGFSHTAVVPEDDAAVKFFVIQPEEVSTLHVQGFIQFVQQKTLSAAKRLVGMGKLAPHLEAMMGTVDQAIEYCQKADSFVDREDMPRIMRGTPVTAGQRKDLETLASALVTKDMTVKDIAEANPAQFVRYHKGLQALADITSLPYAGGPKKVMVYYGPTGTGKTRKAFTQNPGAYFWGPEQKHWFQGYSAQDVCIMDEFRGQLPLGFMLRLTDRYPMIVETKGSSVQFVSSTVIICSPAHPRHWYTSLSNQEGKIDQLLRRIESIEWFGEGPEPDPTAQIDLPQFDGV